MKEKMLMKEDKIDRMSIEKKREKLLKKEISISDLSSSEVELMKKSVKNELNKKKVELNNLNLKIKAMKEKIDNWAN